MGKLARRFLGRLAALADKPEMDWQLFSGLAAEPGTENDQNRGQRINLKTHQRSLTRKCDS